MRSSISSRTCFCSCPSVRINSSMSARSFAESFAWDAAAASLRQSSDMILGGAPKRTTLGFGRSVNQSTFPLTLRGEVISPLVGHSMRSSWRGRPLSSRLKVAVGDLHLWLQAWWGECAERLSSWASLLLAWKRVATLSQSFKVGNTGKPVVTICG